MSDDYDNVRSRGWWYEALRDGRFNRASTTKAQTLVATLIGSLVVIYCTIRESVPDGLTELVAFYMSIVIIGRGISRASDVWEAKKKDIKEVFDVGNRDRSSD